MTTQVADGVIYDGRKFVLCGRNGPELFDPTIYGLVPAAPSTACYRGWMADFAVNDFLMLKDLFIFHDAGLPVLNRSPNGPLVNSIAPVDPNSWCGFNCLYQDVNLTTPFTGGLLIADGFIKQGGVNMGFHRFWEYEIVLELIFESGHLQSVEDKSAVARTVRQNHLGTDILGHKNITDDTATKDWIEHSFSLNYNRYL
ncbi:hypothetical protein ACN9MZ_06220 [Pseudoduganella sp. S-14]|uniref:hypothetical protein n=1 Tax=Pseudoduganella sp. S-14 TaxID=3404065 RepID=UPI003CE7EFDD